MSTGLAAHHGAPHPSAAILARMKAKRARLTPQQTAFVRLFLGGELSRAKAYALAYRGPDAVPEFGDAANAAQTLRSPHVRQAIAEGRALLEEVAACNAHEHIVQLEAIRDAAMSAGQYAAATSAEKARGKIAGLYTDQVQVMGGPAAPIDLQAFANVSAQDAAAAYAKIIRGGA